MQNNKYPLTNFVRKSFGRSHGYIYSGIFMIHPIVYQKIIYEGSPLVTENAWGNLLILNQNMNMVSFVIDKSLDLEVDEFCFHGFRHVEAPCKIPKSNHEKLIFNQLVGSC